MSTESKNDMERIQKNLEQFLIDDLKSDPAWNQNRKKTEKKQIIRNEDELDMIPINRKDDNLTIKQEDFNCILDNKSQNAGTKSADIRYVNINLGEYEEVKKRKETSDRKCEKGKIEQNTRKSAKQNKMDKKIIRQEEKRIRRKKRKRRMIAFVVVSLLILCMVGWYSFVSGIYERMTYKSEQSVSNGALKENGVTNILLIGSDSRTDGDEGRSDAMILLSISKNTKTIQMISLLRDMYVEIPGHDGNRLNAAYAFGGPELLMETVSLNLGIEVHHYVVVNFQAFANLVDAVGGVELDLTNEEVQWVNAYLNEYNLLRDMPIDTDYLDTSASGTMLLNGPQALAFSRNRYIGTDFGRTERQRKVLAAVIKKLPFAAITNLNGLVDGLFPNLTTNLTKSECLLLSLDAGKLVTYDLVQSSVPRSGTYSNANIRGMAVLQVDFEANKNYIEQQIYGE